MKHNYTFNFLIQYLYKENRMLRRLEIENQIAEDSTVAKEYGRLYKAFKMLPRISFYPSDKTMNSILEYSRNTGLTVNA